MRSVQWCPLIFVNMCRCTLWEYASEEVRCVNSTIKPLIDWPGYAHRKRRAKPDVPNGEGIQRYRRNGPDGPLVDVAGGGYVYRVQLGAAVSFDKLEWPARLCKQRMLRCILDQGECENHPTRKGFRLSSTYPTAAEVRTPGPSALT